MSGEFTIEWNAETVTLRRAGDECALHLERATGAVAAAAAGGTVAPPAGAPRRASLLYGTVDLLSGPYLVVATRTTVIGKLGLHSIEKVDRFEVVALSATRTALRTAEQVRAPPPPRLRCAPPSPPPSLFSPCCRCNARDVWSVYLVKWTRNKRLCW